MPYTYQLAGDVVFKEVSGGGVLLSQRSGQYRQVNATGARVLQLLISGEPQAAVLGHMIQRYPDIDQGQLSQDLSQMLGELANEGVLVRV